MSGCVTLASDLNSSVVWICTTGLVTTPTALLTFCQVDTSQHCVSGQWGGFSDANLSGSRGRLRAVTRDHASSSCAVVNFSPGSLLFLGRQEEAAWKSDKRCWRAYPCEIGQCVEDLPKVLIRLGVHADGVLRKHKVAGNDHQRLLWLCIPGRQVPGRNDSGAPVLKAWKGTDRDAIEGDVVQVGPRLESGHGQP